MTKKQCKEIFQRNLENMRKQVGEEAFRDFLNHKAILKVWRGTNPTNVWLESLSGDQLWHSDGWCGFTYGSFTCCYEDGRTIPHFFTRSGGGLPFSNHYKIDRRKLTPEYKALK